MKGSKRNYVVCIRAEESSDIEVRKIYEVLPDEIAAKRGYVRVVDESGEDYLYPEECFSPIQLSEKAVDYVIPERARWPRCLAEIHEKTLVELAGGLEVDV